MKPRAVLLLVLLSGCATPAPRPQMALRLEEPSASSGIITLAPGASTGQISIEADGMRWRFALLKVDNRAHALAFRLENKTTHPITLSWDQISVSAGRDEALRITHRGVRLLDRAAPMAPSVVPPGGTLEDFVFPTAFISWVGRSWFYSPWLESLPPNAIVRLYVPLQVGDQAKAWSFRFRTEPALAP